MTQSLVVSYDPEQPLDPAVAGQIAERWQFHCRLRGHWRRMTAALRHVEAAEFQRQQAAQTFTPEPYNRAAWKEMRRAVREVVLCGCPRDLWPKRVQAGVPEAEVRNLVPASTGDPKREEQ